ncbi:MAG TPA: Gfo/Idh/MocA family oxidoreductase [Polyangia bacterium]|nr:Gfo/Idh/MocA family oxidoreductase [Polyangia bacterium]
MSPVGIAVIGAGPWGQTLAGAFASLPEATVRWICELDEERLACAGAAHPGARTTGALEEVLRDPGVTAVVVAVEPARHHAIAMRALEADKHVFVEKPLALSACDAEEVCAAATARRRVLSVGHLLLHHAAVRQAREIVGRGELGEPLTFVSRRATPGPPRKLGSAWWALAPHDVSLALHLFDALPTTVSASGGAWGRAQEDNLATAVLRFAGGGVAHVHVARFAPGKRRETTIAGPKATLTFDELATPDRALRLWTPQQGELVLPVDRSDALRAQCLDFATRAADPDAAGGDGGHALDVVRVLEAGQRSMRQRGAPQPVVRVSGIAVAGPGATSFEAA